MRRARCQSYTGRAQDGNRSRKKSGEISEKTTFFTLLPPFSVVFMPNNLQIPHYFSYFTGFLARGRLPATLAGDSTTPETWTSFLA